jgi:hypothetical protein
MADHSTPAGEIRTDFAHIRAALEEAGFVHLNPYKQAEVARLNESKARAYDAMRSAEQRELDALALLDEANAEITTLQREKMAMIGHMSQQDAEIARLKAALEWKPMDNAPRNATDILLLVHPETGYDYCRVGHWAEDMSGSEQPPFRGWFERAPHGFTELSGTPTAWMAIQSPPARGSDATATSTRSPSDG